MITPLDIQNKVFKKSIRGYDAKSVDIFLDEVIEDYEKIYKENIEFKDKINMLSDQLRQYNTMEETLNKTLIIAQTTADDVVSNARKKADNIIEDAEITSKKLIEEAHNEVKNIKNEYEYLKKEIFVFKTRYQSFIQAQLISLDEFYNKIEKVNQVEDIEQIEEIDIDEEKVDTGA